jgi:hypothetical protein
MSTLSYAPKASVPKAIKPGGLIKRQCACGDHTIGGAQCRSCANESEYENRRRALAREAERATPAASTAAARASAGGPLRSPAAKSEAAFRPAPDDEEKKIEGATDTGAKIGGVAGLAGGAVAGALLGGAGAALQLGLAGAVFGLFAGALIGALVGWALRDIRWKDANYTSDAAASDSTTVEQPFDVSYKAKADKDAKLWRLDVDSIEGGVDIAVHTGGSRDPFAQPPTTEAEAADAVTTMKGYYPRGNRGSWHTEAASRAHEEHHYREWKCTAEHYWGATKADIETLTAPMDTNADEASAIATMRAGPAGADAKVAAFATKAHAYWMTLSDSAGGRPYAAGQRVLNKAVHHVQVLARRNDWTVEHSADFPSAEPPCYQPWI